MRVAFSRDRLLNNRTLKQKIGTDIEKQEEFFDVAPFIFEVSKLLKSVLARFIKIAHPEFVDSANRLLELSDSIGRKDLSLTKMYLNDGKIDYKSIALPVGFALDLTKLINEN